MSRVLTDRPLSLTQIPKSMYTCTQPAFLAYKITPGRHRDRALLEGERETVPDDVTEDEVVATVFPPSVLGVCTGWVMHTHTWTRALRLRWHTHAYTYIHNTPHHLHNT